MPLTNAPILALFRHLTNTVPPLPAFELTNKRYLVTGANRGLGYACAKQLLQRHATVVLAVRTPAKGQQAKEQLMQDCTGVKASQIEIARYEATELESVIELVQTLTIGEKGLDAVILNASLPDGELHELIQVNVLAPALLALLLLPELRNSAPACMPAGIVSCTPRIVFLASDAHAWACLPDNWAPGLPILTSLSVLTKTHKVCNNLWLVILAWGRMLQQHMADVLVLSVVPGLCEMELKGRGVPGFVRRKLERPLEDGARALAHAASVAIVEERKDLAKGGYWRHCEPARPSGFFETEKGRLFERQVWDEVIELLEKEVPGVSEVLRQRPDSMLGFPNFSFGQYLDHDE